jgi:5-hydroxyisourate hydrolase-like protein (transthyretin family)
MNRPWKGSCLFLSFFFLFFLTTCKKQNGNMFIVGKVIDATSGSGLSGVSISLSEKKVESGTFFAGYSQLGNTTTNGSGDFSFEFERANASEYKLEYSKNNYFEKERFLNPGNLTPGEDYRVNTGLYPKAVFEVHIVNTNPFDEEDNIVFQNMNADFTCECCDSESRSFAGMDVDETFSCDLFGNYWLRYFYQVDKDSESELTIDSVYCEPFETTLVEINY